MAEKKGYDKHLEKLGPGIFIVVLVIILEVFWWFMHA